MSLESMLQKDVTRLLGNFGSATHVVHRSANPTKDRVLLTGSASNTDIAITAHVSAYDDGQVDGSLVQAGDIKVLIYASQVAPITEDDQLVIDSVVYDIISVRPVNPTGTILGYIVQGRS